MPLAGGSRAQKAIARARGPPPSRQSFLGSGEAPPVPGRGVLPCPGVDQHVEPGNRERSEAVRAPPLPARRRLGEQWPLPGLGSPPARRPHLRVPPRLAPRGWGPGTGSAAAASPASPEAPSRPFLPGRGPKPRNPAREGQGGQNSQSFPAHGSRAASRWRSRPGGVAFPSALRGWAPGWAS